MYVHWTKWDKVIINGASHPVTINPSDPSVATVANVAKSDSYLAYYPGIGPDEEGAFLPEIQPYTPGSFAPFSNPMVAYSTSTELSFKNICGVIRVGITGSTTLSEITLSGNNREIMGGYLQVPIDEILNGDMNVWFSGNYKLGLTMPCEGGLPLDPTTPKYAYFVVPAQLYSKGFTVTATDTQGNTCIQTTTNSVTVERSKIKDMEPFAFQAMQPVAITLDEVASTSISYTVSGRASTDIRTIVVSQETWDYYLNNDESYPGTPEKLAMDMLSIIATTVTTDSQGKYSTQATHAYTTKGMSGIQAAQPYKILTSYVSGALPIGKIIITDVRTADPSGLAPTLNITLTLDSDRPYAKISCRIEASDATNIEYRMLTKAVYDKAAASGLTDTEIAQKHGYLMSSEEVAEANNGGYTSIYVLESNSEYVFMVLATSKGGMETVSKETITTAHYIDPAATWRTVSTNATFSCGLLKDFGAPLLDITGLTVEKMDGKDFFRLKNVFTTSNIPMLSSLGLIELPGGPYYLLIDATDPAAVKMEPMENPMGLTHYSMDEMKVGSMRLMVGEEFWDEFPFGTYNAQKGMIDLQTLGIYPAIGVYATDPSVLYLYPSEPSQGGVSTENFEKDPAPTPW